MTTVKAMYPHSMKAEVIAILEEHHYPASYATNGFINLLYSLCREHMQYAMEGQRLQRLESVVVKLARQRRFGFLATA